MSRVPITFSRQDVTIDAIEDSYSGFFRIRTYHLTHSLFIGGTSPTLKRELFERGEAVAVLLYDPAQQLVVLTEQFRIGALEDERSPWLLELVAGMVESGECIEDVARRETAEEAGCQFSDLIPICRYWVSPGGTNERIHVYCGLVDSTPLGGIHGLQDEGEDIRLVKLPLADACSLLTTGEINNAATIIALQWLQLNHTTLRPSSALDSVMR